MPRFFTAGNPSFMARALKLLGSLSNLVPMKLFFLFLGFVVFGETQAQFNDSTFYMLRYSATGILNRTNDATSYALSNALRFGVRKKELALNSNTTWVYGEQQTRLTNNDFATSLDANWFRPSKPLYYWALANFESSFSLKVNMRTQSGVGLAYNFVDKPDFFINLSEGLLFEKANLRRDGIPDDVYSTWRNSFRLRLRYVHKQRITLESTSFIQHSLQQASDYIITSNNSILVKLHKGISFTSALKYDLVQRNRRENLLITFGFTAESFF